MGKKATLALPELSMWQATCVEFDQMLSLAEVPRVPVTIFPFPVVVLEVK